MLQCRLLNVPNVIAVDVNIAIDLGDARLIEEAAMSTLGSSVISTLNPNQHRSIF